MRQFDSAALHVSAARLLYGYTAIADRKDIDEVVAYFGEAVVRFPHATAHGAAQLRDLFGGLWSGPHAHRHVVTNLLVDETSDGYTANALYSRWSLEPDPVLTTMGSYELTFSMHESGPRIDGLVVSRLWPALV